MSHTTLFWLNHTNTTETYALWIGLGIVLLIGIKLLGKAIKAVVKLALFAAVIALIVSLFASTGHLHNQAIATMKSLETKAVSTVVHQKIVSIKDEGVVKGSLGERKVQVSLVGGKQFTFEYSLTSGKISILNSSK